jgi:hypothetical protein
MRRFFYLFLFIFSFKTQSQLLSDAVAKQQLLVGLDKLYNYQFAESTAAINKVKAKYPNHPALFLLAAMQLQTQYPAFESDPKLKAKYTGYLNKCIETATPQLDNKDLASEAKFFLLAAHGYLALANNYEKEYMKAANEARKAYGYLKDGFELMESNPEFYFSTGLYNFYMIQYPITHPAIKPVMVFFSGGNKKTGLQQLETAVRNATFTRAEATFYLVNVLLKYENNIQKALTYSSILHEKYPNNLNFLMRHAEALTLAGKYTEAKEATEKLQKNTGRIYQIAANTFEGIIAEKNGKDDKKAAAHYNAALALPFDERYTVNYHAMSYAGLARIAIRAKNMKLAKQYYQKCDKIAEYEALKAEAKGYL